MRTFEFTLIDPSTGNIFKRDFPKEYLKFFKITQQISIDDIVIDGIEDVCEGDFDIISDFMESNLHDPMIWFRLPIKPNPGTNISFQLTDEQDALVRRNCPNGDITPVYRVGGIFLKLRCDGMVALISQFIADRKNEIEFIKMNQPLRPLASPCF